MMRARVALLCIVLVGTAVACSVVDDGKVERIDPQFGLDDTLPSSTEQQTTTTQLATTTIALATTTPVTLVQTEQVRLYFVTSGQLNFVNQSLPTPVALPQIVAALLGPPADAGYRTIVPVNAEIHVTTDGTGVARVTLPDDFFDLVSLPSDQRLVIAQLVLTLTSSRGIGQVVFNLRVPLPTGQERPAGQQLAFNDYESMLTDSPVIPDPTSPPTTTTVPTTDG